MTEEKRIADLESTALKIRSLFEKNAISSIKVDGQSQDLLTLIVFTFDDGTIWEMRSRSHHSPYIAMKIA